MLFEKVDILNIKHFSNTCAPLLQHWSTGDHIMTGLKKSQYTNTQSRTVLLMQIVDKHYRKNYSNCTSATSQVLVHTGTAPLTRSLIANTHIYTHTVQYVCDGMEWFEVKGKTPFPNKENNRKAESAHIIATEQYLHMYCTLCSGVQYSKLFCAALYCSAFLVTLLCCTSTLYMQTKLVVLYSTVEQWTCVHLE